MIFIPYEGTDQIKFGDSLEKCIQILGSNYIQVPSVLPDIFPETVSCYFNNSSIHLSFCNNKLEYIGFNKLSKMEFEGINFFKLTFTDLKKYLKCNGDCWEDATGIISFKKGLSFYFDDKEDGFICEVGIFPLGYYDGYKLDSIIV